MPTIYQGKKIVLLTLEGTKKRRQKEHRKKDYKINTEGLNENGKKKKRI